MRTLVALPLLLLASITSAQMPQLLATEKPGEKPHPVTLTKADVQLFIAGRLCQTTMTLTFHNDADRVLEGELVFPLPENATVCGYGLDVGGQIVDAVTIEKEKARVVFETESRRGIDPGIVEQVQGNNFRTRVHPIPAKGTRTVRVQYVSAPVAQGDKLVYALPVHWQGASPEMTVRIESISSQAPKVEALPGMKFESRDNHHLGQQAVDQSALKGEIVATLPADATPAAVVEERKQLPASIDNLDPKLADQITKTDFYFLANQTSQPDAAAAPQAKPRHIAIAWDASLSRAKLDHAREFEFLKKHLAALGDVLVEVIPFRNVAESEHTFMVRNGDSTEVLKFIAALQYDGGTSISSVNFAPHAFAEDKPRPDISYYLLFTDGLSDLGPELPPNVTTPVYPVTVDPRSNHNVLRRLAAISGGQYLNLQTLDIDQALAAMTEHPFSLLSIDADPKEIADVYPKLPQPVHGPVTIAGRILAPKATLTLNYGRDGKVTQRIPVTVTRDGATHTGLVSRYWAQLKLADLSIATERNAAEITELGKQFNLVTPYTSMIVLETLDQYLRHKIVPPKSRGDLYAQFMQQIEQRQAVAQKEEQAKIDRVLAMWNQRLEWWKKDFTYPADFKYKEPPAKETAAGLTAASGEVSARSHATRGFAETQQAQQNAPAATPAPAPRPGAAPAQDSVTLHVEDLRNMDRDEAGLQRGATFYAEADAKAKKSEVAAAITPQATITLKPWSPDTPYLKALQSAPAEQRYNVYLEQRKSYETSPAFYLDCADFFATTSKPLALRILTNIPELGLDDGRLLRICAHRLQQFGEVDLAIDLFEKVVRLRPEEPQSFRDLALALSDRAGQRLATLEIRDFPIEAARPAFADFQRALELLHKVVMNQWDRFDEIEVIALTEANRIVAKMNAYPEALRTANPFDPRLIKLLDPDLRIVMTWDTDNTDIDLHVTEPTGETCVYNHNRTTIGGALSKDFTQGYGPEEYLLKKLMPGQYKIQAHFYGNRDQRAVGPTTVQATVITHYGRPDEKRQSLTLRLKEAKDMVDIGTVTLK